MKMTIFFILPLIVFSSCKQKEKEASKNFVSIVSLIKKQVAHVDTSLYPIIKIDFTDSLHPDTTYIPREQFAEVARDFLEIPDLSDNKVASRYKEDPAIHEKMLNRVILTYTPIDPKTEEFKKQEILATAVPGADAQINNIIVIREISNRDSFLLKKMLWQVDRSFQVVTISQKPGQPEVTRTMKVTWNEDPYQ